MSEESPEVYESERESCKWRRRTNVLNRQEQTRTEYVRRSSEVDTCWLEVEVVWIRDLQRIEPHLPKTVGCGKNSKIQLTLTEASRRL